MKDITSNEMKLILTLVRRPNENINARNLSKIMNISHMGALKIAKRLEKEGLLTSKRIGKGIYYYLDLNESYVKSYIGFLLKRESKQALPYVRRWITELKKITQADVVILFGSILTKYEDARDVDVLLITDDKKFNGLKKEIEDINLINIKKVHPIYQTEKDLEDNIKKGDKVVLNAVKGIIVNGENKLMEILSK